MILSACVLISEFTDSCRIFFYVFFCLHFYYYIVFNFRFLFYKYFCIFLFYIYAYFIIFYNSFIFIYIIYINHILSIFVYIYFLFFKIAFIWLFKFLNNLYFILDNLNFEKTALKKVSCLNFFFGGGESDWWQKINMMDMKWSPINCPFLH